MLLATDLPSDDDRRRVREVVPWGEHCAEIAGMMRATLDNGAVEIIEAQAGPGELRAALVTLYEATDVLLQAAIEIGDSVVSEALFSRQVPRDPLRGGSELEDAAQGRFPLRAARFELENAAVKVVSAGDHLVNVVLRTAWEANAATEEELRWCGLDLKGRSGRPWSDATEFKKGLYQSAAGSGPVRQVLGHFVLVDALKTYVDRPSVRECRRYRNQIVHRERPSYSEAIHFGRSSRWSPDGRFSASFPLRVDRTDVPTIDAQRQIVSEAGQYTLELAERTISVLVDLLKTLSVRVELATELVTVSVDISEPRIPREARDPGQFILPRSDSTSP